jgi:hypothetical protein
VKNVSEGGRVGKNKRRTDAGDKRPKLIRQCRFIAAPALVVTAQIPEEVTAEQALVFIFRTAVPRT